jgi:ParB family chromosome partitioning protein
VIRATVSRPNDPAFELIPLEQIEPSPRNPRRGLQGIEELAASIRVHGLLQPIVVRRAEGGYQLVAGHRRHAAVRDLGWTSVQAIVREVDEQDAYVLTLVENLQRDDLTPREEARALETLLRERGWTTRQVAEAIQRSASYVSRRLRVFEDPVLAPYVLGNRLSVSAAEELLTVTPARRPALAAKAAKEGWEHAQVRRAVRETSPKPTKRDAKFIHHLRQVRRVLRSRAPTEFSEPERSELRRLFMELALVAKAPKEPRPQVFPPLPVLTSARSRSR